MDQFRINESGVVHETIDGEVVVINLETGAYYSLEGPAADVWDAMTSAGNLDDIVRVVCERYDVPPEKATSDVQRFLEELCGEDLVVADSSPNGTGAHHHVGGSGQKQPFEPLQLRKFTDMEHLLLLDPVHDVDDQMGWPIQKQEAV